MPTTLLNDIGDVINELGGSLEALPPSLFSNFSSTALGLDGDSSEVAVPELINNFLNSFGNDLPNLLPGVLANLASSFTPEQVDGLTELWNDIAPSLLNVPALEAAVDQLTGLQNGDSVLPLSADDGLALIDAIIPVVDAALAPGTGRELVRQVEPLLETLDVDSLLGDGVALAGELLSGDGATAIQEQAMMSSVSIVAPLEEAQMYLGSSEEAGLMAVAPNIELRTASNRIAKPSYNTELFWWMPPGGGGTWGADV